MDESVKIDRKGRIAVVRMNRLQRRNALAHLTSHAGWDQFNSAATRKEATEALERFLRGS